MTTVSFPGLGIGEFKINPVAFTIPIGDGIEVRWYGLIIVTGMILAFLYCTFRSKQEGIVFDDLLDIAIFTIIFSVVGARLYYVLTSLDQYDSFLEVFAVWNGGLAIYGGIIAGAITIFTVCRVKKYKMQKTLGFMDSVAPALMIGQLIGRWGNFCNGEAFGSVIPKDNPLYFIRMALSSGNTGYKVMEVHPTFLYESLWNLVGFIIINALYKKKKFNGQIVLMYLSWYGFGRMFIEGLRTDSLYIFKGLLGTDGIRISQLVGLLCFVGGLTAIIVLLILCKKHPALCRSTANGAPIAEETVEETAEEIVEECVPAEEAAEEAEIDEWEGFDDEPDGEIDELTDLENAEDAEAAEVLREEALLEGDADTDADFEANDGKQNETEQKDEETKHGNEN